MAKTPGLNLPFGIDPVNAVPVDAMYGPYASLAAAKAAVPLALRYDGLTVQITGLGNYWWLNADLTDTGLIAKGLQASDLQAAPFVPLSLAENKTVEQASNLLLFKGTLNPSFPLRQGSIELVEGGIIQRGNGDTTGLGQARQLHKFLSTATDSDAVGWGHIYTQAGSFTSSNGTVYRDHVYVVGMNVAGSQLRIDNTRPYLADHFESKFTNSNDASFGSEVNRQHIAPGSGSPTLRYESWFLPFDLTQRGVGSYASSIDVHAFCDQLGVLRMQWNLHNNQILMHSMQEIFDGNNRAIVVQRNAADSAYLDLPYIDSLNRLKIQQGIVAQGVVATGQSAANSIQVTSWLADYDSCFDITGASSGSGTTRYGMRELGATTAGEWIHLLANTAAGSSVSEVRIAGSAGYAESRYHSTATGGFSVGYSSVMDCYAISSPGLLGYLSGAYHYVTLIRKAAGSEATSTFDVKCKHAALSYKVPSGTNGHVMTSDASGNLTLQSPAGGGVATDAIWDAAGDLAVGSGANTASKLSMGTALQVICVNAGATTLEYVSSTGTGAIMRAASPTTTGTLTAAAITCDSIVLSAAGTITGAGSAGLTFGDSNDYIVFAAANNYFSGNQIFRGPISNDSGNLALTGPVVVTGAVTASSITLTDAASIIMPNNGSIIGGGVASFSIGDSNDTVVFGAGNNYFTGPLVLRGAVSNDSGDLALTGPVQVTGAIIASGSVAIGSGTAITKVLSATATLNFASIAAQSYEDLTITITGAALGDTVSIGVPNGSLTADISFFGWVSAADTVTIRCTNVALVTARDPALGTFRATVTKF